MSKSELAHIEKEEILEKTAKQLQNKLKRQIYDSV